MFDQLPPEIRRAIALLRALGYTVAVEGRALRITPRRRFRQMPPNAQRT